MSKPNPYTTMPLEDLRMWAHQLQVNANQAQALAAKVQREAARARKALRNRIQQKETQQ